MRRRRRTCQSFRIKKNISGLLFITHTHCKEKSTLDTLSVTRPTVRRNAARSRNLMSDLRCLRHVTFS